MGLIDIIKSLSTFLSSAVNKSRLYQEKKFLGIPRIEHGADGSEAPLCYAAPMETSFIQLYSVIKAFITKVAYI